MMKATDKKERKKITGLERASILLLSLGEDDAAAVLKNLSPKEVQKIGMDMVSLKNIQKEHIELVLDDFIEGIADKTSLGVGSHEYIRRMLVNALGEEKAAGLIDRILLGANTKGLDTLKWMDARAVANVIRNEHPQIMAIVIAYLDPDQAADVLVEFDERVRTDIMMRVASLESVQPSAINELNTVLEKQFSGSAGGQAADMGGEQAAADIMNYLDSSSEAMLLDAIRDTDESLGARIQDLMFVFENLVEIDDRGIQALLREVQTEGLVIALKGADDEIREKIFKNMSKRAAELLRDDLDTKGPVRVSEVETAQKDILTIAKRMSDAGEISLGGKSGDEMI